MRSYPLSSRITGQWTILPRGIRGPALFPFTCRRSWLLDTGPGEIHEGRTGWTSLAAALATLIAWDAVRAQDVPVPPPVEPDQRTAPVSSAAAAGVSSSTKAIELPDVLVTAPTGNA